MEASRFSNQRIALAAVLVTGVVGVAGPLITWQATKDTQEAAASAELVRSDRADLRDVLDHSASNLDRARVRAVELSGSWFHATKPLPRQQLNHLSDLLTTTDFNLEQLHIRLGSESPAYRAYSSAQLDIEHMAVAYHGPPVHKAVSLVRRHMSGAINAQERFENEAHKLAESTVP